MQHYFDTPSELKNSNKKKQTNKNENDNENENENVEDTKKQSANPAILLK